MKFDMSTAWQDATQMMAGNKEVLMIAAGIFFFLPALVIGLLVPGMNDIFGAATDPEAMQAQLMGYYADYWWAFLIVTLAQIVGYLALLALLRDASRPTLGDAISGGLKGLLPALVSYFLIVLVISVVTGLLIGIAAAAASGPVVVVVTIVSLILAVYMMVKFSLIMPVVALDRQYNPFKVLARSWKLTKGNSFRLFLFYALIVIVYFVLAIVVGMLVALMTVALGDTLGLVINAILSGAIGAVVAVVFVAVLAAIHRQLAGPSAAAVSETFD